MAKKKTPNESLLVEGVTKSVVNQKSKKAPTKRVHTEFSHELIDKIAAELAEDKSFSEIAKLDWAPGYSTMMRWQASIPEVRHKWMAAKSSNLEDRKKDRIQSLLNVDLTRLAMDIMNNPKLETLTLAMKDKLFKARVDHIYKEIDYIYKELAIEFPEKYGSRSFQNINLTEENKNKSLPELEKNLKELLDEIQKDYSYLTTGTKGAVVSHKPETKKGSH